MAPSLLNTDPTPLEVITRGPKKDAECLWEVTTLETQRAGQPEPVALNVELRGWGWVVFRSGDSVLQQSLSTGQEDLMGTGRSARGVAEGRPQGGSRGSGGPARGVDHPFTSTRLTWHLLRDQPFQLAGLFRGFFCLHVSAHSFPSRSEAGPGPLRMQLKCMFGFKDSSACLVSRIQFESLWTDGKHSFWHIMPYIHTYIHTHTHTYTHTYVYDDKHFIQ